MPPRTGLPARWRRSCGATDDSNADTRHGHRPLRRRVAALRGDVPADRAGDQDRFARAGDLLAAACGVPGQAVHDVQVPVDVARGPDAVRDAKAGPGALRAGRVYHADIAPDARRAISARDEPG